MMLTSISLCFLNTSFKSYANDFNDARRSTELTVSPDFNFNSFKKVKLDIQTINDLNKPIPHTFVRIYGVSSSELLLEKEHISLSNLLSLARTNEAGWVIHEIELPHHVKKLLLVLDTVDINNKKLVTLTENSSVLVAF